MVFRLLGTVPRPYRTPLSLSVGDHPVKKRCSEMSHFREWPRVRHTRKPSRLVSKRLDHRKVLIQGHRKFWPGKCGSGPFVSNRSLMAILGNASFRGWTISVFSTITSHSRSAQNTRERGRKRHLPCPQPSESVPASLSCRPLQSPANTLIFSQILFVDSLPNLPILTRCLAELNKC